jgi:hypothetical protein
LKTEIDANRPLLSVLDRTTWTHTVVFTGYAQILGKQYVGVTDPWPGSTGWYLASAMRCDRYYPLPAGALVGTTGDPEVAADTDGDGVRDFDEGASRAFHCAGRLPIRTDQVPDKGEIRSYTFHDLDHPGHDNNALQFADLDSDGVRAENDCDSDDDSDFDGGEDIDGNGDGGTGGGTETDMYQSPHLIEIHTNKRFYRLGEDVLLLGKTFHRDSQYWVEVGGGCPDKQNGDQLAPSVMVATAADGTIPPQIIDVCTMPAIRYAILDVLRDQLYSEPDNLDPETCWSVDGGFLS